MTPKEFRRYVDRDGGCVHCGETEAIAPHHRLNRGMGGSKARKGVYNARNAPSNILTLCSALNGAMEALGPVQAMARSYGWKLSAGDRPHEVPVWHNVRQVWVLLDDEYGSTVVKGGKDGSHQGRAPF
jgi:hypothetical protein